MHTINNNNYFYQNLILPFEMNLNKLHLTVFPAQKRRATLTIRVKFVLLPVYNM